MAVVPSVVALFVLMNGVPTKLDTPVLPIGLVQARVPRNTVPLATSLAMASHAKVLPSSTFYVPTSIRALILVGCV